MSGNRPPEDFKGLGLVSGMPHVPRWFLFVALIVVCSAGVGLLSRIYSGRLDAVTIIMTDFTGIVAGGYLTGTPGLYQLEPNLALQRQLVGTADPARVFPRWPYLGYLLRPLASLPYQRAAQVWFAAMVGALACFILLFPATPPWVTAFAVCWSIPVFDALSQGQDSPLLLIYLAVAMRLYRAGWTFAAGAAIALCAPKYHLFVLMPVLILMQRQWRLLAGGLTGGAALLAFSTLIQGPSWLGEHLANIRRPEIDAFPGIMPNLRGALAGSPLAGLTTELVFALGVALWTAWLVRGAGFENGLSLVLIGGMLVSHHAYLHDCILLIPAFLTLGWACKDLRPASVFLLCPFATILLGVVPRPHYLGNRIYVLLLVCFLGLVSTHTLRRTSN